MKQVMSSQLPPSAAGRSSLHVSPHTYILYGFAAFGAFYIGSQIGRVAVLWITGNYP